MTQEMTDRAFARYALGVRRRLQEWDAARRIPRVSGPEVKADLEREWARQRAEEKAQTQAQQDAEDTGLEIAAVDLYQQLGKAIGGITTQESWCDLDDRVTALVEAKGLSSRHGRELHERLLRVAKDRRWVSGGA